jgi:ABC-type Na+ efflux pump permease subunit
MNKVLGFTFLQNIRSKSYITATVVIALLCALLSAGAMFIAEMFIDEKVKSDIDYVYVSDSSALDGLDYNAMHSSDNELYKDIVFVNTDGDIYEAAKKASEKSDYALAMEVTDGENDGFTVKIIKPEGFAGEKKSPDNLSGFVGENLKYVIYEKASISPEQKDELLKNISVSMSVMGEDGASDDDFMKNVIPVVFGIFLYMLLCLYGQSVSRSVVLEKDSKMMEMMLVSVKPSSLIFGKMFGMYFAALFQLLVWGVSLTAGVATGLSMNPSVRVVIFDFIGGFSEKGGFSLPAAVLSIVALLVGFLLFISLAAFTGTFASKTEEVNSYYGIYTMAVVISWMVSYINGLNGNEHVLRIARFIPFTAPFTVPADILIGTIDITVGCISVLIMFVSTALIVFLAGKVYKLLVLYRGNPPKVKELLRMAKKAD